MESIRGVPFWLEAAFESAHKASTEPPLLTTHPLETKGYE